MGIKTVQDTSLTSVANAIRVKAEISGTLEFPDEFVSAIQNISTGITPSGTKTITENGTYDVTNFASADVNVSGGGASNLVEGTFTTGSSAGTGTVNVPYTGSGYPLMVVVVVDGGAYVPDTTWYNSVQRYAVGQWTMTKSDFSSAPTYATTGAQNKGVVCSIYKNSTSNPTTYTRSSSMSNTVYSSEAATGNTLDVCKLMTGNVLSYYVNTSSYGLLPNTTYRYFIVYSS